MVYKRIQATFALLACAIAVVATGCFASAGPSLGILSIPIPVSPYFQKLQEDKFEIQERYARVPIMGPITAGGPIEAIDPPSDHECMAAFERARPVGGGVPFLHEGQRNNVVIVKKNIADYIDPPRVVPLLGPVQLHHAHYKVTIYYTERKIVGWPIPHTLIDEDAVEVLYIDHNHFHMVGNVDLKHSTHY